MQLLSYPFTFCFIKFFYVVNWFIYQYFLYSGHVFVFWSHFMTSCLIFLVRYCSRVNNSYQNQFSHDCVVPVRHCFCLAKQQWLSRLICHQEAMFYLFYPRSLLISDQISPRVYTFWLYFGRELTLGVKDPWLPVHVLKWKLWMKYVFENKSPENT